MLRLPRAWIWDLWVADDGELFHVFYLQAPRSLGDPDLRHRSVSVGHAVSSDLRSWEVLPDALTPHPGPRFDDLATWTGSVVRAGDGTWRMYYTGASVAEDGLVQRVGLATSQDLVRWERHGGAAVSEGDPRWYEQLTDRTWGEQDWRDPWVFLGEDRVWHMLLTARANAGAVGERGVVGHATSPDGLSWTSGRPLSSPGAGFAHLEVMQVAQVDGRWVLVFSCHPTELSPARRAGAASCGVWVVEAPGPLGPFDLAAARPLTDQTRYSGRLVRGRDGGWQLLATHLTDPDGRFVGTLADPMPVGWLPGGRLGRIAADR